MVTLGYTGIQKGTGDYKWFQLSLGDTGVKGS